MYSSPRSQSSLLTNCAVLSGVGLSLSLNARNLPKTCFRLSILAAICSSLSGGVSLPVTLQGWGTAYVRTSVLAGRVGRVQIGSPESSVPAALRLVLMRTR